MPNLSASEYTQFLKFKAAAASPIAPAIQTRSNATLSQSVLNANILASQAAFMTNPYNVDVVQIIPTVSAVSSRTVSAARADVLSAATANGTIITYTSSQAHGLTDGDSVQIQGFTGTLLPTPNRTGVVTVIDSTSFSIPAVGAASGTATGTGRIEGSVYYTTTVAHGLSLEQTVTIDGVTTFSVTGASVIRTPTATTFVLSFSETGTAVSGQSGTIVGFVYYTTTAAHNLVPARVNQTVAVSGITSVLGFNVQGATILVIPSSTVFVLGGTTLGAVTSQTGIVVVTTISNPKIAILGNGRIVPQPPNNVNNPNALSTVTQQTGGVTSSSKFQQPGGLPAKNVVGTYHRIPQQAGWA